MMIDMFKQFFSFNKLMKDRLVAAFFYLGLVVVVIAFWATLKAAFLAFKFSFTGGLSLFFLAFFQILFLFIALRLLAELMIAVFHINDNLSPDGGKSETADIDILETTREVASRAAKQASEATKSVVEKTKGKLGERGDGDDESPDYEAPKPAQKPVQKPARKPQAKKSTAQKTPANKPAKKTVAKKSPAKKSPAKKTGARKTVARKTGPKKASGKRNAGKK